MIAPLDSRDESVAPVAVLDVGNTSIGVGLWRDGKVSDRQTLVEGVEQVGACLKGFASQGSTGFLGAVVLSSVVPATATALCAWIEKELSLVPWRIGREVALPIEVAVPHPERVGVDRICTAAAAYSRAKQACVVVDFGTAITVDVVDDGGAFLGGSIFPGLALQARALHDYTAQLPQVIPSKPDEVIGRDTAGAIRSALYHGTSGAVRGIVEAYATHLGRWPPVVATGGDAALIAEACDIFDAIVPDLCLLGVGLAYDQHVARGLSL